MSMRFVSVMAAGQYRVALLNLEAGQLPQAECAAPCSLEALRLEDPATMSGCWNPGYAMAGCSQHPRPLPRLRSSTHRPQQTQTCADLMPVHHVELLFRASGVRVRT